MRNPTTLLFFRSACRLAIHPLPYGRVSTLIMIALFAACGTKNEINPNLASTMPTKIIWAWERPEDLRFLDAKDYGVAFLAQTIFLDNTGVTPKPRRQPLEVSPGTYMIAVTRMETNKDGKKRPSFDAEIRAKVVSLVKNTLELPDVKAIQIDFDAVVSERNFYRSMMIDLRKQTPEGVNLTMTSLASWCTGDAWFNDFPVDEAVPMAFEMGADSDNIKDYLRKGNDWSEPLCRGSYGISIDDPLKVGLKPDRRVYYFSNDAWKSSDLIRVQ